jgi:guanylate kinase
MMPDEPDQAFTYSRRGTLFIVSAPSGVGKTTLARKLVTLVPDLRLSISCTTRAPRQGEKDGCDYYFIDQEQFLRLRVDKAFAEWAPVHDFLYGTPRAPLDEAIAAGRDLLLDIDVQGARQIKALYREAVSIFVLPPSWQELERRLRGRGTDSEEVITRRLQRAREEASELFSYDYYVINDQVDRAVTVLQSIIIAEHARVSRIATTQTAAPVYSPAAVSERKRV